MRILVLIIFACLLFSCQKQSSTKAGLSYFPKSSLMENGLVWKYYYHTGQVDGDPKTNIRYRKVRLDDDIISVDLYDAAFERIFSTQLRIEDQKWILAKETYFDRSTVDELFKVVNIQIEADSFLDWGGNEATVEKLPANEGNGYRVVSKQISNRDSIANNKTYKIFTSDWHYIPIKDNESTDSILFTITRIYEMGLGMVSRSRKSEKYFFNLELDKIMSVDAFEELANHGTHRVAYIDTLKTIDDYTLFKPCNLPEKIYDYYNDRRAQIEGGKGRLRIMLQNKLNPEKIKNESGYLTFRFVINCEGQAGWFVTEEASLDFERKSFSSECKTHLYEMLKEHEYWTPLLLRGTAYDAYTYITFKMKNGEIIEMLP